MLLKAETMNTKLSIDHCPHHHQMQNDRDGFCQWLGNVCFSVYLVKYDLYIIDHISQIIKKNAKLFGLMLFSSDRRLL